MASKESGCNFESQWSYLTDRISNFNSKTIDYIDFLETLAGAAQSISTLVLESAFKRLHGQSTMTGAPRWLQSRIALMILM